jgi:anti-repressor protein
LKIAEKKIESVRAQNIVLTEDVNRMRPKELFADAVAASSSSILIGELAKILRQNGVDTGEKRLFHYLRQNGYLISRKGTDYNMPMQRSMELKLFEIKERTINNPDGSIRITKTVLVTGKGQQYFINKFLREQGRE